MITDLYILSCHHRSIYYADVKYNTSIWALLGLQWQCLMNIFLKFTDLISILISENYITQIKYLIYLSDYGSI